MLGPCRLRSKHRLIDSQCGTSIIEFAVCLPMILVLLVGTVELGRILNTYLTVNRVVYEAVRYASARSKLECGVFSTEADAPSVHMLIRDRANLLLRRNGMDEVQDEQLITELRFVSNSSLTSDSRFLGNELQVRVSLGVPFQPIFGSSLSPVAFVNMLRSQSTGAYLYDVPGGDLIDCDFS